VRVRFLAEAEGELDSTVAYYNSQLSGLGAEFATEVSNSVARIEEYPKAWQLLGSRVRRYRLSRFPYGLVYIELESEIVILAVMHLHRRPDYWAHLVPEE
jgi:hypothetical protein